MPAHDDTTPAMTKYEIVNPSDYCTLEADNYLDAVLACIALGGGQYALEPIDADGNKVAGERVPLFIFGGFKEWWIKRFPDRPYDDVLAGDRREAVARVLDSVNRPGERSSMNDIQGRARQLAAWLRGQRETAEKAPRQVFGA